MLDPKPDPGDGFHFGYSNWFVWPSFMRLGGHFQAAIALYPDSPMFFAEPPRLNTVMYTIVYSIHYL